MRMIKIILTIIATINLNTVDTHKENYEPFVIETNESIYQIEEDYSVSQTLKGGEK